MRELVLAVKIPDWKSDQAKLKTSGKFDRLHRDVASRRSCLDAKVTSVKPRGFSIGTMQNRFQL